MSKDTTLPDNARHTPISMDGNPTIDERANHCFGCGPANPQGLHLHFTTDTSNPQAITATCHFQLDRMHEGPRATSTEASSPHSSTRQ
ncbi:hypothetical protein RBB78_17185 [Tunturiibacter empetritectus]|uniref:hypothetical protein n=1 Tax=Tunturiibacter empetritectus TaxID=3069691 RepID=UPI003D9BF4E7